MCAMSRDQCVNSSVEAVEICRKWRRGRQAAGPPHPGSASVRKKFDLCVIQAELQTYKPAQAAVYGSGIVVCFAVWVWDLHAQGRRAVARPPAASVAQTATARSPKIRMARRVLTQESWVCDGTDMIWLLVFAEARQAGPKPDRGALCGRNPALVPDATTLLVPRRRSQENTFLRAIPRWRIWVTHSNRHAAHLTSVKSAHCGQTWKLVQHQQMPSTARDSKVTARGASLYQRQALGSFPLPQTRSSSTMNIRELNDRNCARGIAGS